MLKLNGLFASKKQIAGLDIGSSSIKIAEIAEGPDGYILQTYASIPLAKGIIADGLIVNQPALVERIKELLKISRCKARTVVTSLSGYSVIAKKIGFPSMDEESLRELISDEIEKYLPFGDMKDVNFDFQILGPSEVSTGQMEVFLVAAKKDVIQSYVDSFKKAGLDVVIMDVDSFALETMYEENYDYGHEDVVIIVNIGASMTNINVVKGGASIFIRDFPLGGYLDYGKSPGQDGGVLRGSRARQAGESRFGRRAEQGRTPRLCRPPAAGDRTFRRLLPLHLSRKVHQADPALRRHGEDARHR